MAYSCINIRLALGGTVVDAALDSHVAGVRVGGTSEGPKPTGLIAADNVSKTR
jgi:hypothetical protein